MNAHKGRGGVRPGAGRPSRTDGFYLKVTPREFDIHAYAKALLMIAMSKGAAPEDDFKVTPTSNERRHHD